MARYVKNIQNYLRPMSWWRCALSSWCSLSPRRQGSLALSHSTATRFRRNLPNLPEIRSDSMEFHDDMMEWRIQCTATRNLRRLLSGYWISKGLYEKCSAGLRRCKSTEILNLNSSIMALFKCHGWRFSFKSRLGLPRRGSLARASAVSLSGFC